MDDTVIITFLLFLRYRTQKSLQIIAGFFNLEVIPLEKTGMNRKKVLIFLY